MADWKYPESVRRNMCDTLRWVYQHKGSNEVSKQVTRFAKMYAGDYNNPPVFDEILPIVEHVLEELGISVSGGYYRGEWYGTGEPDYNSLYHRKYKAWKERYPDKSHQELHALAQK